MTPVLHWLADPNLIYVLLVAGFCGLLTELAHPGGVAPGLAGAALLLLAAMGLVMLPVNPIGLFLVIIALTLFALDAAVTTHGGPTVAGLAAFFAGSLLLFNTAGDRTPGLSPVVVVPIMLAGGGLSVALVRASRRARHVPALNGPQRLLGAIGVVTSDLHPSGTVRVGGEVWTARACRPIALPTSAAMSAPRASDDPEPLLLASGRPVRVVGRRGLTLEVEPVSPAGGDASGAA